MTTNASVHKGEDFLTYHQQTAIKRLAFLPFVDLSLRTFICDQRFA